MCHRPPRSKTGELKKDPLNTFLDTFSSPKPTKASKSLQCLLILPSVHELFPLGGEKTTFHNLKRFLEATIAELRWCLRHRGLPMAFIYPKFNSHNTSVPAATLNSQGRFGLEITEKKFQGKVCKALKEAAQSSGGVTTHGNVQKMCGCGTLGQEYWK